MAADGSNPRPTHQTRPSRVVEDHPCPTAAPPPRAEDCGDRGTYRSVWWQGGMGSGWKAAGIVIAILLGLALLRHVIGPMLSPAGP